jgi:hypothetical protein
VAVGEQAAGARLAICADNRDPSTKWGAERRQASAKVIAHAFTAANAA